jgi:HAE1 family hydrophobic/amphiphilic exporter-1
VTGVAEVRVFGGEERRIDVVIDFAALALRGLSIADLFRALTAENVNVRGGGIEIGKRRYQVRTVGLFMTPDDIGEVVVAQDPKGAPIYVKDVATVYDTFADRTGMVRINGEPAISFGVVKKSDANTIRVVGGIRAAMTQLNREIASKGVFLDVSYDSSDYIWESISFVTTNFVGGAFLAVATLLVFLKSFRSTMVIGVAIPIVTAAGFILMNAFDRSLNIISLAGMAFAVGMVVDNSIVSLENIYRHLQMGGARSKAALDGAVEVWGAILASTATTLAVFVPIVYVREEAGQLFGDIAIAISVTVGMSLLVAVTVIPALSAKILDVASGRATRRFKPFWRFADRGGARVHAFFVGVAVWLAHTASLRQKGLLIAAIVAASLLTIPLAPKMEYLPTGNRNLIFVTFKPYVGSSLETSRKYSDLIAERIIGMPQVAYMFHIVSDRFSGIGVRVTAPHRLDIAAVTDEINRRIAGIPGFQFYRAFQTSLFTRATGSDIEVELRGPDLDVIGERSIDLQRRLTGVAGVSFVRSNLEGGAPEFQVRIDRNRAAAVGLRVADVAEIVEAMVAGKKATIFKEGGSEFDIVVRGDRSALVDADAIRQVTVYGAEGKAVRLDAIADVVETVGPSQINHIEMDRSVTLQVTKASGAPLQQVVEEINATILDPLRAKLPPGYYVTVSGSAADLDQTIDQLSGSFVLAMIVVYLLMAALFESWSQPFIIMFAAPLAFAGAILGVRLTGSPLDVLTMLGFVILTGIVVNNAILLIHQATNNRRYHGMSPSEALVESVRTRIRPIFMSAATTVLGMLPLVLRGGAGSELYAGLGAAIVGGLTVSTLFTLVLIPAIYLTLEDLRARRARG